MQALVLGSLPDRLGALADWLATLPDWQAFALLVGGAVLLAAIVHVGGDLLLRRLTARIPGEVDDVVFGFVHLGLWVTILVGGTALGLDRLGQLGGFAGPVRAGALSVIAMTWTYALVRMGRLREFGDSGLQVELLCWIDDRRLRGRATDSLMREVYVAFREADVEIPFPQRDLHIRENGEAAVPRSASVPPAPEGAPSGDSE